MERIRGFREAKVDPETMEDAAYWLAPQLIISLVLHTRSTCPWVTPPTVNLAFPHQLLIKKIPTDMPTGQFNPVSSSGEGPSSQVCQGDSKINQSKIVLENRLTQGLVLEPLCGARHWLLRLLFYVQC